MINTLFLKLPNRELTESVRNYREAAQRVLPLGAIVVNEAAHENETKTRALVINGRAMNG